MRYHSKLRAMSRDAMIEYLLRPISEGARGRARRYRFDARHRLLNAAYPLMTPEEKARADHWLERWPVPTEEPVRRNVVK